MIANTDYVSSWKSKGLSVKTIKPPTNSNNSLTAILGYYGTKNRVKFTVSCLQQPKVSYNHGTILSIYIVYELGASNPHKDDSTLKSPLFGAVRLTKNTDIDEYGYSDNEIGFNRKSVFSFPNSGLGQNVVVFGVDMSSSVHFDNKKRHFNSWKRSNARRFRRYTNCRKNVFN